MTVSGYRRSIADCSVAIRAKACLVDDPPAPELIPFAAPNSAAAADLELSVRPDGAPPAPAGTPLFATQAWELWALPDGGYQVALIRATGKARPMLVADRATRRVVYHEAEGRAPIADGLPLVFDPFRMPVDQLLLIQHLAFREGFIVHSAGFAFGDVGIVVPGVSGAGKSTLTSLLSQAIPEMTVLSDERIIVRSRNGAFEAWGTPWMGTAGIARNLGVPLRALVFLAQNPQHGISAIPAREAVRRLFGVLACPLYDAERSELVLRTVERLVSMVPTFELRFARDSGVGAVVLDFLRREMGVT